MPQLIEHIDKIARDKNRNVLYLTFHSVPNTSENEEKYNSEKDYPDFFNSDDELEVFENNPNRKIITDWLTKNGLGFSPCGDIGTASGWRSYKGQIYLDFSYESDECKKFEEYFKETSHGWSNKFDGVRFYLLTLDLALKNKHHDEPGFWENWAGNY